jgi:hypothetical protein
MAATPPFVDECRPPWVVFPEIDPRALAGHLRQGAAEVYFADHWGPFWSSLASGQRVRYLDHWQASPEWREAIEFHFEAGQSVDAATDVRESEDHLARHHAERAARRANAPWWQRLFRRGS